MAKFKVGDNVRILDGSSIPDYRGGWADEMAEHVGEVHKVESVDGRGSDRVSIYLNGFGVHGRDYIWDERGLERADNVNHPPHYETNGIECIVAMEAAQGAEAVQAFCICNAFKYIWRHKHKNGAEDIRKAVWYLQKWLEIEGREDT